jgi:aldehyde dehydrogenase (NAD+)
MEVVSNQPMSQTDSLSTNAAEIEKAHAEGKGYFASGKTLPYEFRIEALIKLGTNLKKYEKELADALYSDLGKSQFESFAAEIGFIWDEIQHTIKHLHRWMQADRVGTTIVNQPGSSAVHYNPYGLCLVIAPWNYPAQLILSPLVGAIAAGNCCIMKPSEQSPHTAIVLEKLLNETFEKGHVSVIQGGKDEVQVLTDKKFDFIFYTGGTRVGTIIYQKAAAHLTPVVLELGGKSPCIINKDAKLKTTVKRLAWGKFLNCGQTCLAPDYVFVHEQVHDQFVQLLSQQIKSFYGNDIIQNKDYGRIINHHHFDRIQGLVKETKSDWDFSTWDRESKFIPPTLLTGIPTDSAIMSEEIFGPVLPVFKYNDFNQVKDFIQARPKPLALYYFGHDSQDIQTIEEQIHFGGGCINDTIMHVANPNLPFGGIGNSGLGAYHGEHSFKCFSHKKPILTKNVMIDVPLRYAPYKSKLKWIKKIFNY